MYPFTHSECPLAVLTAWGSSSLKNFILFLMSIISLLQICTCLYPSFPSISSNIIFSETFADHQWWHIKGDHVPVQPLALSVDGPVICF